MRSPGERRRPGRSFRVPSNARAPLRCFFRTRCTFYEGHGCQAPRLFRYPTHTFIEAAEQALPNSRARAGGRITEQRSRNDKSRCLTVVRAGGFILAGARWLQRTFYPCRRLCAKHQRRHPGSLGEPSFCFSVHAHEPGTDGEGSRQLVIHASASSVDRYPAITFSCAPTGTVPVSTYRQSATSNLRASATMPIFRARRLPPPNRRWYHRVNALVA